MKVCRHCRSSEGVQHGLCRQCRAAGVGTDGVFRRTSRPGPDIEPPHTRPWVHRGGA